jgi:hypothetical protein
MSFAQAHKHSIQQAGKAKKENKKRLLAKQAET